jgi:hypothetical protein
MKTFFFILFIAAIIILLLFIKIKRSFEKKPPGYGLIQQAYYVCYTHKLLSGGIFGKGPVKEFSGLGEKNWCYKKEWVKINKVTFLHLAEKWYGKDLKNEGEFWAQPDMSPCNELRESVTGHIRGYRESYDKTKYEKSIDEINKEYQEDPNSYITQKILRLKNPEEGRKLLKSLIQNKKADPFTILEAASVLAAWGDQGVVNIIQDLSRNHQVMTNSEVEYFLIKSSLTLLGQSLTPRQLEKRSVFLDLEKVFEECYHSQTILSED